LDDICASVRRSVEDSLRRLRVDQVTSVQVHNRVGSARLPKADLGVGAQLTPDDVLGPVLDTLRTLRNEGKTQAIGCCAWGGEYASVCQVVESGAFDTVLVGYSILNPTAGRAKPRGFVGRDFGNVIERAAAHGTSAVVLKVLESGALTGAIQPHPNSALARRPSSEFIRPTQTLTQAAIRYALANPNVATVLVGFSAIDQIEEAATASSDESLTTADLARIEELYGSAWAN
jgi:aryl-alcohol dehydrogenase-like predicted oxidoreductase